MSVASTKAFYSQVAACFLLAFAIAAELSDDDDERRRYRHERLARAARAPGRDARAHRPARVDRGDRATQRVEPAVVGGRRQRREPRRRARDPDQALRALLQVDRVRRDRGQEAHRPLGRADDPRVRGRAARFQRRRRRQGDRDLPCAQGRADRDRRRRREPLLRRGRHDLGSGRCTPTSRSCSARWPVTSSVTKPRSRSTRRPGRCAKRAVASRLRSRRCATARIRSARSRPRSSRTRRGSSTSCARATTTAASKRRPRCALASVLRYATGLQQLDTYQIEFGKVGTPSTVVEDLNAALTKAIEELTRPIDAIKHQAKTVTVGISRSDETLLLVPLVKEVLAAGAPRDSLTYRALRTLVALDRVGRQRGGLDALQHRGRDDQRRRPRWHRARHSVAHRDRTRCCAAASTAPRPNARSRSCAVGPTAARRSSCPK